jgi:uncharacterized protein (TIGR03067 family)
MPARPRLGAVLLALVLAAVSAGQSPGEAHARSARTLDGAWTAVSAEREGQPAAELRGHTLTFVRETFVIRGPAGRVIYRGTYTVDATKRPARVDFRHTEGELEGKTWLGIYVLDGDRLEIADNAVDLAKPRPASLSTTPGSGHVRLTFERARP